jgi:3-oxoacyl-[acyl-carrier-protein] synthase II
MGQSREIVITGVGMTCPLGNNSDKVYESWLEGQHNFSPIKNFNVENTPVQYAGHCLDPDTKALPDRKVQKILRRKDLLSLLTTIRAAQDADIKNAHLDPDRMGMYVGTSATQIGDLTPYFTLVAQCADLKQGTFDSDKFGQDMLNLVNPLVVLQTLMNNALCFGTMTLDLRGVNANFMDFQVSGLRAIGEAFLSIRDGRADLAIAGGVAGPVEPFQLAEGVQVKYLAHTLGLKRPISEVIRPWDKDRMGTILSEGTAYVVLEEKQNALKRGAKIYASIKGFGLAHDGHLSLFSKKPALGLELALQQCIAQAGVSEDNIAAIIGHGNGSHLYDWNELRTYERVFKARKSPIWITSPYASLGDLCEASGPCSTILGIDCFQRGVLPATANHMDFEEPLKNTIIARKPRELDRPYLLITSRNFFGLGCALLLGKESA